MSATSATIASPIGARAASSGSLVIATSSVPSREELARDVRVVGEDRGARHEHQVVRGERPRASGPTAGGRTPWKAGWSSGKPMRPPPVAGEAHTGSRWRSTSSTAASQPPRGVDVGAGDEQRALGRAQPLRERRDLRGVRARAPADDRARDRAWRSRRGSSSTVPVVHRDRDERRTRSAAAPRGGSPARARTARRQPAAAHSST